MKSFANLKQLLGLKKEFSKCMIVSEQEGAEIWLNGRKTVYKTPRLLSIPRGQEVMLEIKQLGHEPKKVWLRSSQVQTFYYCDLKRIPLRLVDDEEAHEKNFDPCPYPQNQKTYSETLTAPR